jgi:hypothetical protein
MAEPAYLPVVWRLTSYLLFQAKRSAHGVLYGSVLNTLPVVTEVPRAFFLSLLGRLLRELFDSCNELVFRDCANNPVYLSAAFEDYQIWNGSYVVLRWALLVVVNINLEKHHLTIQLLGYFF